MTNVVPLNVQAKPKKETANKKWGEEVLDRGFCMVPSILIRGQKRLGLTTTQLVILLNLIDWWIKPEHPPWSSKEDLADRIGIKPRQLQRQIADLEKAGLVKRIERKNHNGKIPNAYDLQGLVEKLQQIAPDFKKAARANSEIEKPLSKRMKIAVSAA